MSIFVFPSELSPQTPQNDAWTNLQLADALGTRDPGSVGGASADVSGGAIDLVALGGLTATGTPGAGQCWWYQLYDAEGVALAWGGNWVVRVSLEVVTPPSLTSDHWISLALTDDPAGGLINSRQAGLHYDASPGPDVRYGGGTDSAPQTGVNLVEGIIYPGLAQIEGVALVALTGANARNGLYNSFSSQSVTTSNGVYLALCHGRSSSVAGTATTRVRAHYSVGDALERRP